MNYKEWTYVSQSMALIRLHFQIVIFKLTIIVMTIESIDHALRIILTVLNTRICSEQIMKKHCSCESKDVRALVWERKWRERWRWM